MRSPGPNQADVRHVFPSSGEFTREWLELPAASFQLLGFDHPDMVTFSLLFFALRVKPHDVGVAPQILSDLRREPGEYSYQRR